LKLNAITIYLAAQERGNLNDICNSANCFTLAKNIYMSNVDYESESNISNNTHNPQIINWNNKFDYSI